MQKILKQPTSLLIVLCLFVAGCKKEATENSNGSETFVSATSSGVFKKEVLRNLAIQNGFGNYVDFIKYDVEFLKLIYKTQFKGKTIEASGLLAIPQNLPKTPSLLAAQHGTIFRQKDSPSNFPIALSGFEIGATVGLITVIPDYIGYGTSGNIPHPYYVEEYSAQAVIDMLKATKYYLAQKNIGVTSRLFMIGYSEGGYVTLAAQKALETSALQDISLTAVAAGAGGYDISGMLTSVSASPVYEAPSFLALFVRSYDSTFNWNRPYSDFFQEPYAAKMPLLLDGIKDRDEIDTSLPTSASELFNPVFYTNLSNPTAESALKQAISDNTLLNWAPKTPTRLYHGTADHVVFYETSVSTYNNLKSSGATNIELKTIPDGTHDTSVDPMMLDVIPWFLSLDK